LPPKENILTKVAKMYIVKMDSRIVMDGSWEM
jgi:hypothetical protein